MKLINLTSKLASEEWEAASDYAVAELRKASAVLADRNSSPLPPPIGRSKKSKKPRNVRAECAKLWPGNKAMQKFCRQHLQEVIKRQIAD